MHLLDILVFVTYNVSICTYIHTYRSMDIWRKLRVLRRDFLHAPSEMEFFYFPSRSSQREPHFTFLTLRRDFLLLSFLSPHRYLLVVPGSVCLVQSIFWMCAADGGSVSRGIFTQFTSVSVVVVWGRNVWNRNTHTHIRSESKESLTLQTQSPRNQERSEDRAFPKPSKLLLFTEERRLVHTRLYNFWNS